MESKPRIKFSLSEKMEFYDDRELRLFSKVYPKIKMEDLEQCIQFFVSNTNQTIDNKDFTDETPSIGALAIRKLLTVLHRESLHCDKDEIVEYLNSLSIKSAECEHLASVVMSREAFSHIPKSIRLRPSIVSMHWMIDVSQFQRNKNGVSNTDDRRNLSSTLRVILLISLSNGRKRSLYLKSGKESWLRYKVRMANGALTRVDACSSQKIETEDGEND